ncbi:MAG: oxidoreductase domain protein [Rhodoglobus sp.]|nr:oxidoreductase domain protein [Rhodoglobus sp.]
MPLRLIHVGLGGWGTNWETYPIPRVTEVERVAIVEPFEPALVAAQEALKLSDAECFRTLEEALAAVESDAVLVTTPMENHVPTATVALSAGKHVLVEKPFAGSVTEARGAVELAEDRGLVLQVSQNYRFYPGARTAARLIAERSLGEVGSVAVDFRQYDNGRPRATHPHYQFTHPVLMDMAIHHFDLLRMILGTEPVTVYATSSTPPWSNYRDEAAATATVTMSDGVVFSYRGSWISAGQPTLWAGDWVIECADGELAWTGRENDTVEFDRVSVKRPGGPATALGLDPVELHGRAGSLKAFARAIETGTQPETSGRDNLGSVALMEAAVESASSGRVVTIALG